MALVLAVDGSGSITDEEYAFQKYAIADAFRDSHVLAALKSANTVAVSAVFWGDGEFAAQKLDWFIIDGGEGAEPFARAVENNQRIVFGNTDIGSGIWSALDLLSNPLLCPTRSIVNVSGDGKETMAPKRRQVASLFQARLRSAEMGVTVNALVIADDKGADQGALIADRIHSVFRQAPPTRMIVITSHFSMGKRVIAGKAHKRSHRCRGQDVASSQPAHGASAPSQPISPRCNWYALHDA